MIASGWHPDPDGTPGRLRWWDGQQWTSATHEAPPADSVPQVDPPQPSPHARRNNLLAAAAAAVVAIAIVGALVLQGGDSEESSESVATSTPVAATTAAAPVSSPPKTLSPSRNSLNAGIAEVACEKAIKERLKSPASADFPDNNTRKKADGAFEVRGVVDSENGFGATMRSYFGCTVSPVGTDQHRVVVDELFQP
ncbi:DUF2510 domain-containing protein [Prescottella equi]|uniref:DUF2510 domain-containing protein n=1 Tax=Rhodococcus hoagii TaxID=43767 RepID=UPI0023DAB418|nr:DUF2510 domain-containing protein [Prescottella equi]